MRCVVSVISWDHFQHGLLWIQTPIEPPGIVLINETNYIHNFQQRILRLKSTLNILNQRKRSLKGDIRLAHSLSLARLMFASTVVNALDKATL